MNDCNYLDINAGIGGFAYGAYLAGFKCKNHFFFESREFDKNIYKKRFPGAVEFADLSIISTLKLKKDYGEQWVITITGSLNAGNRENLWFEPFRIIRGLLPKYIIIEDVPTILNSWLSAVVRDFAKIGYSVEWQDLRARDFGAAHKRQRIWLVAYPNGQRLEGRPKAVQETKQKQSGQFNARYYWKEACSDGRNRIWGSNSDVPRVAHGVSDRVDRIKSIGNAIVPQIAAFLFRLCENGFRK